MAEDASEYLPPRRSLTALRSTADECRGCDLWRDATQTVFGVGPAKAGLMLVGASDSARRGDRSL